MESLAPGFLSRHRTRCRPGVLILRGDATEDARSHSHPRRDHGVTADPTNLTINAVSLIETHRDNRMYEWRTVEAVPLGHSA